MMLVFFLVNVYSVNWLAFDTERKLISACNLCQMVVDHMQLNFSNFSKPNPNSPCSQPDNPNMYCKLIADIHNDITSRYEEEVPSDYCSIHGPCIFVPPSDLMGINCAQCLNIITYTFEAEQQKRESVLKNYCSSAIGSTITFCNGVEYVISKSMKNQFLQYNSATDFCIEAAFCNYNNHIDDQDQAKEEKDL